MKTPAREQVEFLIGRLTVLPGPDHEVDRAIGNLFGYTETTNPQIEPDGIMPAFTGSIDAALALVSRALPEHQEIRLQFSRGRGRTYCNATISIDTFAGLDYSASQHTPAITLCIAMLRAVLDLKGKVDV